MKQVQNLTNNRLFLTVGPEDNRPILPRKNILLSNIEYNNVINDIQRQKNKGLLHITDISSVTLEEEIKSLEENQLDEALEEQLEEELEEELEEQLEEQLEEELEEELEEIEELNLDDLDAMRIFELRSLGKKLGLKIPTKTKRVNIIELIKEKSKG